MLFSSRLCLGTHSCFTEIQCEYVGGLSHNQCIQTFRCRRQLVFACHGLDSWGWFLMCVGAMSLHVGKLTLLRRWRFFTLRRNSSRRTICGSCTAIITPCSVLHFSDGLFFTPGNPNHFCVFQLPSWTFWFPSRTRGRGKRCAQPRPARPMGRPSVGAEEYRFVWWRSSQGMSGPPYPLLSASQFIVGHRIWRERGSNVCIPSLPQR